MIVAAIVPYREEHTLYGSKASDHFVQAEHIACA